MVKTAEVAVKEMEMLTQGFNMCYASGQFVDLQNCKRKVTHAILYILSLFSRSYFMTYVCILDHTNNELHCKSTLLISSTVKENYAQV